MGSWYLLYRYFGNKTFNKQNFLESFWINFGKTLKTLCRLFALCIVSYLCTEYTFESINEESWKMIRLNQGSIMANLCLRFWALECNTQWPVQKPDTIPMRSYFMHSLMIGDKPTRHTPPSTPPSPPPPQGTDGSWNWRQIACKWVTRQRLNYKLDHSYAVTSAQYQSETDRDRLRKSKEREREIRWTRQAYFRFSPASDPALWSHTRTVGHPAALAIATSCPRSWSRARLATRWVAAWPDLSYARCRCHTAWPNYDADTRPPVCSNPRRHFVRRSHSPLWRHVVPH